MNMKNLNVFRRLDELETDNLYLRTMLKNLRLELTAVGDTVGILENMIRPKPKAKPGPKPKPKVVKASEKRREYARKYYAKKKAEKLAVTA